MPNCPPKKRTNGQLESGEPSRSRGPRKNSLVSYRTVPYRTVQIRYGTVPYRIRINPTALKHCKSLCTGTVPYGPVRVRSGPVRTSGPVRSGPVPYRTGTVPFLTGTEPYRMAPSRTVIYGKDYRTVVLHGTVRYGKFFSMAARVPYRTVPYHTVPYGTVRCAVQVRQG